MTVHPCSRVATVTMLLCSLLAGVSAQADIIRVTYSLAGSKFEIRNTPFGAGDGSFEVGPGSMVIDYAVEGNAPTDGGVQMRSYALLLQFTSGTTGLQITTDLTTVANFSDTQTFAQGQLEDGVLTWVQSFPYNAQGSNTCNGGFCGFAGFQDGVPQVIDSEDPFTLAPFRFEAGGPAAGAGFTADEVQVPGNDSADTFLILKGTVVSSVRIDTTPPVINLIGDAELSVPCGSAYVDAGATASDNFSISDSVSVSGDVVDTATPGIYVITYNVADDADNPAQQVTRTVTVQDNCPVEEGAIEGEGIAEGQNEGSPEGIAEGTIEGSTEGISEGLAEGANEGITEGISEGLAEGITEGVTEGISEGSTEGTNEGISEGLAEGSAEGVTEGTSEGLQEGTAEGLTEGEGSAEGEGIAEGILEGEGSAEGEGALEDEGAAEGENPEIHSGDSNNDGVMDLSEVLRIIQFYNGGAFGCAQGSEDGFALDTSDRSCTPHNADYISQDWLIDLSELLRVIQLYNFRGYRFCPESDDGFCPHLPG